jgi:MYXO-CTERM domain-containing protein
MKYTFVRGLLFGIALSACYLPTALADVPPPDGYVEECTVAKKQVSGRSCAACQNDYRSFATSAVDPCQSQYASQGYEKICKSWGASVWTEVWCRGEADAGNEVTPPPAGGCGCRASARNARGPFLGMLILGALFATRFHKRRVRG